MLSLDWYRPSYSLLLRIRIIVPFLILWLYFLTGNPMATPGASRPCLTYSNSNCLNRGNSKGISSNSCSSRDTSSGPVPRQATVTGGQSWVTGSRWGLPVPLTEPPTARPAIIPVSLRAMAWGRGLMISKTKTKLVKVPFCPCDNRRGRVICGTRRLREGWEQY